MLVRNASQHAEGHLILLQPRFHGVLHIIVPRNFEVASSCEAGLKLEARFIGNRLQYIVFGRLQALVAFLMEYSETRRH
ncbi:hypothetical protein [Caballeronia arvi]|uniref:hypothetical protein n=1 Tax=Caballeronia arvi TaxID=1777135 RepID=UPI0013567D6D|nr:hypothetical protein [Caballeronia arvi]